MAKDKRLPMPEGSVPNLTDPWDDGERAFTTAQVRDMIQSELAARKVKGVSLNGQEVEPDADGVAQIGTHDVAYINALCGNINYTLLTAIAALKAYEEEHPGYVKPGMVMVYRTDEHTYEAKMLHGTTADIEEEGLWRPLAEMQLPDASATPEEGSTNAFSAGGAYRHLITDFEETLDVPGNRKIYQAKNAAGENIGNPIEVPYGSSEGGGASAFAMSIKDNPLYGAVGSSMIAEIAIVSVEAVAGEEVRHKIKSLSLKDATTGMVLWSEDMTEPSSASMTDYRFTIDLTQFFTGAASRDFIVTATNDMNKTVQGRLTAIAIDASVEVSGVQTLHYTNGSVLRVGGNAQNILLYKFPRNASRRGITAYVDILWNGEWREFGQETVTDTYTHSPSINPCNVFGGGERMTHSSYLLRIHGEDVASGVRGNTVYTTLMCVDPEETTTLLAVRYNDLSSELKVKNYQTVNLEVAAYTPAKNTTKVEVYDGQTLKGESDVPSNRTIETAIQVLGADNDNITPKLKAGSVTLQLPALTIDGSIVDMTLKEGAVMAFDMAGRNNSEVNHSIESGDKMIEVTGSNWSSNGFVRHLGSESLRVAEGVTGRVRRRVGGVPTDYHPLDSDTESTGAVVQFMFATENIKDDDAMLLHCYNPGVGAGFYVKGNKAGIYCQGGNHEREERSFKCGEIITMAVVVEPVTNFVTHNNVNYSTIKMFLNGEEVSCIGYTPGAQHIANDAQIEMDGTNGDFYLYYMLGYDNPYTWRKAFDNYVVKLRDAADMVAEAQEVNVLNEQNIPDMDSLLSKGISCYAVVASEDTWNTFYGSADTSENLTCTLIYKNAKHPCLSFIAYDVRWRRQGTTSAKRPEKNDRFYLSKASRVELLNPDPTTELGRNAIALAAKKYVMVTPEAIPVQVITVKVDFSDSSNANDCGVCDLMNDTYRALGSSYMTPAQRAFDGTFTKGDLTIDGRRMDHSTKNHPIAAFRATNINLSDAVFRAKANWKEDKSEQVALGFKDTPGYNLGCLNYGDFYEFYGNDGESLEQVKARFLAEWEADQAAPSQKMKADKPYLLSLYCGRNYKIMRHDGTQWEESHGSMRMENGRWVVTGDVLNPVTGFELLNYQGMCWWRGVSSVADMMRMQNDNSSWVQKLIAKGKLSSDQAPAWTAFFECMVDDDDLTLAYAQGKKVPYELYRFLKFCSDCDMMEDVGQERVRYRSDSAKETSWRNNLHRYASVPSAYSYAGFTDYMAAGDQRAKNMQPMWFLEDGFSVTDGVYSSEDAVKMYLNKIYDCDTCNGKDNDGGCTFDPEADPNKPSDDSYTNPYAGWGSVLFNNIDHVPEVSLGNDNTLSLRAVISAMRNATFTANGESFRPFSPEGAMRYFVRDRLLFWPKLVSSYDGENKYINLTFRADALYFYALQGLGLTSLPRFIEQRWRIRDGYYGVGGFFAQDGIISGRINAPAGARITFKAAKTGYFGIGNDSSGSLSESVFLEAGQSHSFTNFSHTEGALLYIYQADRMSEIDLSEITLDNVWSFANMNLVEKIKLGKENKQNLSIGSYLLLQGANLGSLPFLKELDVTGTTATSINASLCPRLERVYAKGSALTSITLAETSPVTLLDLPSTMTSMSLVNLPSLRYPASGNNGLKIDSMSALRTLSVMGCPNIDVKQMVQTWASDAGSGNYDACTLNLGRVALTDVDKMTLKVMTQMRTSASGTIAVTSMDMSTKIACINRWGDIDAEDADLRITYPKVSLVSMRIDGPRNVTNPGDYALTLACNPSGANDIKSINWNGRVSTEINGQMTIAAAVDASTGVVHVYHADIDNLVLTVTVTAICEGGITKTAQHNIKLYMAPARPGDYVYADGSYDSELLTGKTVVGICFWANPDDAAQRLAVALSDASKSTGALWGPTTTKISDDSKDRGGKNEITDANYLSGGEFATWPASTIQSELGFVPTPSDNVFANLPSMIPWGLLRTLMIIKARGTVNAPSSFSDAVDNKSGNAAYYPAASICNMYEPTVGGAETLAECFTRGHWFLPTTGELARICWYHKQGYVADSELAGKPEPIFKDKAMFTAFKHTSGENGGYYYTSNEETAANVYAVDFTNITITRIDKLQGRLVRPVVAF